MGDKLKEIVNETIISPYCNEDIDVLNNACQEVVKGGNFDTDYIAKNLICHLQGVANNDLNHEIENYIETNKSTLLLKPSTFRVLPAFVNYMAINSNDIDKEKKALFSLAIMNTLLLMHGHFDSIRNIDLITPLINKIFPYLEENIIKTDSNSTLGVILNIMNKQNFNLTNHSEELKLLAQDALYYYIEQKLNDESIALEKDKFVMAAKIAKLLVDVQLWPNINFPLKQILDRLKISTNKLPFCDIIQKILDSNVFNEYKKEDDKEKTLSVSSIILRCLTGDSQCIELCKNLELNASEFFIYLYYELILERALDNGRQ